MVAYPGVAQIRSRPRQNTSWQEDAACGDTNPRIFFDPKRYEDAKLICAECPVKIPCKQSRGQADGVWGGQVYGKPPGRPKGKTPK